MKKIFLIATFVVASICFLGVNTPNVKAATIEELQAQIQTLLAQIAELQRQLAEITGQPTTWCHSFNVNLKIGSLGSEVTALQTALSKEGLYTTATTGNFDEYTASAVVGFQEKYASEILTPWGLTHGTGYVGSTTRAKLIKFMGAEL